jgi:NAD(P)-dependent dehydrogenase (short-subunit alcohol dehydrogenase family)
VRDGKVEQGELMKRLEGKKAVVTGGNSGIGLASAKRLAEEGAKVFISGRDAKTLESAAAEIGAGTLTVQADVSKLEDIDKLYAAVKEKFGKLDILFVNAGIAKFAPLPESTEALFDEHFDINVKGLYFTVQKALPYLNEGASIILNTSIVSTKGEANTSIYAATKAAARSIARTTARELLPSRIRVNAVAPGYIATPIFARSGLSEQQITFFKAGVAARIPMKRLGTAEEVAAAVAFLASDDSTYITGVELNVDGGMGQL